jgi:hypothetical protein
MDYPLENLGAARFQRVCQALLAKEFPAARLTPLTNQDGGRDAFIRRIPGNRGLVVFQVKYAESPASLDDPRKWVLNAVEKELPKIKRLLPRGLEHYRLITNVGGSAHLGTGSIDKLDEVLAALPCPADGWWRDDLLGRLDDAWNIKWSFPELFTGPDLLRAIIDSGLSESRDRRSSAISAFLADQCDEDARVKFKQVELENRLLDLYVDVELTARPYQTPRGRAAEHLVAAVATERTSYDPGESRPTSDLMFDENVWMLQRPSAGAARVLLSHYPTDRHSWAVIEGAPGQGKSTVTQYVCQVHRMRLLGHTNDLAQVPVAHKNGPLRLPFRVDLRDLAGWLHGRNPFGASFGAPVEAKRTLETFFAAQVEVASGGAEFSVADLHAVARISSVLLAFDGLDEVADIEERRVVVREVTAGLRRLTQISASLQAVVTSRPAAFENSPGFAQDAFSYFELIDLGAPIIDEYATRWIKARGLRPREASAVRTVLKSKLDQSHMRELARNPMQLAILLSLINRRGPSLPDKRTALYDSYVSTFFDREAEKTEDVQRHRELLLEIHQYLAWHLQATAEKGRSQGSISEESLRDLLIGYLTKEEKDPALVDVLFKSLVERVVAIVSRVQGTYEFEVQPLREYFAARYLYDTAHYSPAGAERAGDKMDRFDALARNFYWLNVTRFFAGCFSKGELPSLAVQLRDLAADPAFGQTDQTQLLSVMLLSDWVFAQHPKSVKAVIDLVLSGFAIRGVNSATNIVVTLPVGSGQSELAERCWQLIDTPLQSDRVNLVLGTLTANSPADQLDGEWRRRTENCSGAAHAKWLGYGALTGALDRASSETVASLVGSEPDSDVSLLHLLAAGHGALVDQHDAWSRRAIDGVLAGEMHYGGAGREPKGIVDALSSAVGFLPETWEPLSNWWSDGYAKFRADHGPASSEAERCWHFLDVFQDNLVGDTARWWSSLASWNAVVEALRTTWGDRWAAVELAIAAAGIESSNDRGSLGTGLFDPAHPLCERARYARLRAGAPSWWTNRLSEAPTRFDEVFVAGLFFAWGSKKTLATALPSFDEWLQSATDLERRQIRAAVVRRTRLDSHRRSAAAQELGSLSTNVSPKTVVLLVARTRAENERLAILDRHLSDYEGDDRTVWSVLARSELAAAEHDARRWPRTLATLRRAYGYGVAPPDHLRRTENDMSMPYPLARSIVDDAAGYPLAIVDTAEKICRQEVGQSIQAVSDVARDQDW